MPFVFGIAGVLLVVSGVRGTTSQLMALLKQDFTGYPNYLEWMVAIMIVGALGYIQQLATLSKLFMTAILIGLLFSNKGFFAAFTQGTQEQTTVTPTSTLATLTQGSTFGSLFQASTQPSAIGAPMPQTTSVQDTTDTLSLEPLQSLSSLESY